MKYGMMLLALILLPVSVSAATFAGNDTLVISTPPEGNAYFFGGDVRISASTPADLAVFGGTITTSGAIAGDALLAGGTVDVQYPVAGDVRALGGRVLINAPVAGDLIAAGGSVVVTGKAQDVWIGGGAIDMRDGANGPVTLYGASVTLSGEFTGDVSVVVSDRIRLAEGAIIHGALKYNAPQEAEIAEGAQVLGGTTYTGSSRFLPTTEEAKAFAVAGLGVFFVVQILAGLVAVGLLAGLFPQLSHTVADRALGRSVGRFMLLTLIGFGAIVATPALILVLFISFVGIGVGLVIGAAYLLFLLLAYLYAGVLAGSALSRGIRKRPDISWRWAVLGMLILKLIDVVPGIGPLVTFILVSAAAGALLVTFYRFSWRREAELSLE